MFKKLLMTALTLLTAALPLAAAEQTLNLDLDTTAVTFTLGGTMHTVEGIMHLKEGVIRFDLESGQASGSVVFDATLTETGNAKRDKKMHKKVLESGTFAQIIFTPNAVEGGLAENGGSDLTLRGSLSIHGSDHPVTLVARVDRQGDTIAATSTLSIPFVEWGMHDPSVFVLRTDKIVEVSLEVHGTLSR